MQTGILWASWGAETGLIGLWAEGGYRPQSSSSPHPLLMTTCTFTQSPFFPHLRSWIMFFSHKLVPSQFSCSEVARPAGDDNRVLQPRHGGKCHPFSCEVAFSLNLLLLQTFISIQRRILWIQSLLSYSSVSPEQHMVLVFSPETFALISGRGSWTC